MTAGEYDFTIEQGATWTRTLNVEGLNLTGASVRMQIRERPGGTLLADLTTDNGKIAVTVTDTENAILVLTLTDEETAALSFTSARYDLEIAHADGSVTRLLEGKTALSQEITA